VMDAFHLARRHGIEPSDNDWRLQCALLRHLERIWSKPDAGLWEVRGPAHHFTHSKIMAWVAFDRGVKAAERFGLDGPVEHWRELAGRIHADVCKRGFDRRCCSFVQFYGSRHLDAALLLIPQVGFLPAEDPRFLGTMAAVERELTEGGLVKRYATVPEIDGLPPGEGCFLACSFWLADAKLMAGRHDEALALFEHLLTLCNDVGLLAEEYVPKHGWMAGNFPQAFSHVALVNTAQNLARTMGPARSRSQR